MKADDTIFALSSGALPAGLAVIRLSGSRAIAVVDKLAGRSGRAREAALRTIKAVDGTVIDRGLVIAFPGPHSFTGEDCVELHVHGSRAVVSTLYSVLQSEGLRLAEAGEFSKRALENGKLDLVQAEGLADLLRSETEMQRRLAVEQSDGGLSSIYDRWAVELTRARALIEAELDFADEDDVPGSVSATIWPVVSSLKDAIDAQLRATQGGTIIRDGYQVAIVGAPNAGKSSLLNALARQDIAIVTDVAGTTRDILHVDLDIDGFLVRFFDTAGIRDTSDIVELEGIRRAQALMQRADLVLALSENDSYPEWSSDLDGIPIWKLQTKSDLAGVQSDLADFSISAKTGDGLEAIKSAISALIGAQWQAIADLKPGRLRHAALLERASLLLAEALEQSELEMRAECLRLAAEELGRITGKVDVEHLLGIIFSEFCIGK